MNIFESLSLFGMMVVLAAVPSTSVALVVTRSATLGIANGLAVSAGIVMGDLIFIALALVGMAAIAETLGSFFLMVKMLAGLYLLWLGFSLMISRRSMSLSLNEHRSTGNLINSFIAGFALTLGDIKAIVFYASLFPVFVDLSAITFTETVAIILITILSVGGVKSAYAMLATKVATNTKSIWIKNITRKTAGVLMICAGGYLIANT